MVASLQLQHHFETQCAFCELETRWEVRGLSCSTTTTNIYSMVRQNNGGPYQCGMSQFYFFSNILKIKLYIIINVLLLAPGGPYLTLIKYDYTVLGEQSAGGEISQLHGLNAGTICV